MVHGVNLAVKWDAQELEIVSDSATVSGWLKSVFTNSHRIQTHSIAEMVIRRHLQILHEVYKEYGIVSNGRLAPSKEILAKESGYFYEISETLDKKSR